MAQLSTLGIKPTPIFLAVDLSGDFGGSEAGGEAARFRLVRFWFEPVAGSFEP